MKRVMREGLEGLVMKGIHTIYEPGKRHWLKMKKDYLAGVSLCVCSGHFSFLSKNK